MWHTSSLKRIESLQDLILSKLLWLNPIERWFVCQLDLSNLYWFGWFPYTVYGWQKHKVNNHYIKKTTRSGVGLPFGDRTFAKSSNSELIEVRELNCHGLEWEKCIEMKLNIIDMEMYGILRHNRHHYIGKPPVLLGIFFCTNPAVDRWRTRLHRTTVPLLILETCLGPMSTDIFHSPINHPKHLQFYM